jgi:putative spermidine/putrescine transport system substrate-binding protein
MQKFSRRKFVTTAAGLATTAITAPYILKTAQAASKELVISSWGGTFQDALREVFFKPFSAETGIEVKEVTYGIGGLTKVKAQMAAGKVEVDLLDGPPFWNAVGKRDGLTQKIDLGGIKNQNAHMPSALDEWGYGYGTISWGIGYNTESFPNGAPKNWSDFWNVSDFPGARGMFAPIAARHLEFALMADGVSAGDVNPLTDAKVDQAFKALHRIKDDIALWWGSSSQAESMLMQRELDMAEFVHGRAFGLERKGVPVRFEYNQAVMNLLTWVMANGAPNAENAQKFVEFSSRPDRQAAFANQLFYGPTNEKAIESITDDFVKTRLPTYQANLEKQVLLDGTFWANNLGKLKPRWVEVTSG